MIFFLGYYVYIEASKQIENDSARLVSPIYAKMENGFCFQFYYHMYGEAIGSLNVYVKKENDSADTTHLTPLFSQSGNKGNKWLRGLVKVESIDQNFQVIFKKK